MTTERDGATFPMDAVDEKKEITDTAIYEGELEAGTPDSLEPDAEPVESLDLLESLELRSGETDDPGEAAEEGLTWIPPVDPPVSGVEHGDPRIAAGFGTTSLDEPYDEDHHRSALPAEDEVTARVREALLADASTTGYADSLDVETEGGVVRIAGWVEDLEDETNVLAVLGAVDGVSEVLNGLRVRAIG
jgi:hypothetical protein